jgi:hypothetical protein
VRILTPDQYRREAELVEQAAALISLLSDKEEMLATARLLRLRADETERDSTTRRTQHR